MKTSVEALLANASDKSHEFRVIVVFQSRLGSIRHFSPHPLVEYIIVQPCSASAARNIGFFAAQANARRVIFADCRTIYTRSFCLAVFSDKAKQSPLWLGYVDWSSHAGTQAMSSRHGRTIPAIDLAYAGFMWRCVVRANLLTTQPFDESIGPGTNSRIKSGEDCLLASSIIIAHGIQSIPIDATAHIDRLPRPDVSDKMADYAFGAGYRLGRMIRMPFLFTQQVRLAIWCIRFLGGTARLILSENIVQRSTGWKRLSGLGNGLTNSRFD